MTALWFWIPAVALSVLVAGLAILGLTRGARLRAAESGEGGDRREVRIYAEQLREIEQDRARGIVSDEEAERLRAETARRLLAADRNRAAAVGESRGWARRVAIALAVATPIAAAALYWDMGAPDYADLPIAERYAMAQQIRAARPSQQAMEAAWQANPDRPAAPEPDARYAQLMDQLRTAMANRPDDQRGLRLLATNEANLGNYAAAATAWAHLIDLEGESAPVEDLQALAETMILATGGRVSPQAEVVLESVLRRDPTNGSARYYLGLNFVQTGRPDLTFRLWRGLLEDSPPDAPWIAPIRASIEELAQIAGVRYTLPPLPGQGGMPGAMPGPNAADVANAAQMSAGDRQQMIQGMVAQLADRLASQGGSPEEWARLINARGVLGQADQARADWQAARAAYAGQADALAVIDAAARQQGLGQ